MTESNVKRVAVSSPDLNGERLSAMRDLHPELFTDEGKLDEQALRSLLGVSHASGVQRFCFDWAGKQESQHYAFTPSVATLVADRDRSVDFDTTQNVIVEGDNLEVLKVLIATYFEQVKCIYIDPPYNTGKDFLYPDNFTESRKAYWERNGLAENGIRLTANPETSGRRHSKWLSMMYPRLLVARQLLRQDGMIFVSIDDHEQENMKKMLEEVFGADNFLSTIVRQSLKGGTGPTTAVRKSHDYIHIYAKNLEKSEFGGETTEALPLDQEDEKGPFRRGRELNKWGAGSRREDSPSMWFPIPGPAGDEVYPIRNDESEGRWRWGKKRLLAAVAAGDVIFQPRDNGTYIVYEKVRDTEPRKRSYSSLLTCSSYTNAAGTKCMKSLFGGKSLIDYPKPLPLVQLACNIAGVEEDDIVLDFFAGSGTTGHAVYDLNATDAGSRRFVLVQIPEATDEKSDAYKSGYRTISSLCIERVKRAGEKISVRDDVNGSFDKGFRVFRLAASHFASALYHADPGQSEADNVSALNDYLDDAGFLLTIDEGNLMNVVTEIALKNGYGLFFNLTHLKDSFPANDVYELSGNGKNALVCFDRSMQAGTVDALAEGFSDRLLMVSKSSLDTAGMWTLQNAFGENLRVI